MLAYDFANNSDIIADQRSYTQSLDPQVTLYPKMQRHAVTLAAHQEISNAVRIAVDGFYSRRRSSDTNGAPVFRISRDPRLEGYAISPSMEIDLAGDWQGKISGVYGRDQSRFRTTIVRQGAEPNLAQGRYFNEIATLEAGAEGPLFDLPGGDARLAIGAGFRNNRLDYARKDANYDSAFDITRRARFGYAELYLPFVARRNARPGLDEFTISTAVRYEDYPGLDQLATPRVGVIYSPVDGLTLSGSWSRSFKAPTLYQQYIFMRRSCSLLRSSGRAAERIRYCWLPGAIPMSAPNGPAAGRRVSSCSPLHFLSLPSPHPGTISGTPIA